MSGYRVHVFVCENRRDNGERCCGAGADAIDGGAVKCLRGVLKAGGHHGKGRVRVNRAGCLDRCEEGPALVVYPSGRWYRYETSDDLREIAEQVIINGKTVERLEI